MNNFILSIIIYFICIGIFKYVATDEESMQKMVLGAILMYNIMNHLILTDIMKKR